MDHALNWLWQGSLIALATVAVLRLLRRSRARARYALCWVALIAVLVLPVVSSSLVGSSPPQPLLLTPEPVGAVLWIPRAWWTSVTIVIGLCVLWSSVYTLRLSGALLAARRARAGCRPFPPTAESRLRCWNEINGLGRRTRLVLSPTVRSAGVLGCGSPVIALAPALLQHLSDDEIDRVVIHEWAHVQRRDDLMNLAHLAARAIAGWHPAVWWLERQLQIEREAACDEIAVAQTGCPKRYAACLTTLAALVPARLSPLPALGALSSPTLSTRVVRILAQRRLASPKWSTGATIVAILFLGAFASVLATHRPIQPAPRRAPIDTIAATFPAIDPSGSAVSSQAQNSSVVPQPAMTTIPKSSNTTSRPRSPSRIDSPVAEIEELPTSAAPPAADAADDSGTYERVATTHSAPPSSLALINVSTPALTAIALQAPRFTEPSVEPQPVSPWAAATDAGVAIGLGSQKAGVAAATFFNRFGKKIARSF